ncbi:MAG: M13 family metallopeptidase [Paludibacteraceae bacterium]|nr:M13 family metallopeptidase [Paludibacteraceae bacterium]
MKKEVMFLAMATMMTACGHKNLSVGIQQANLDTAANPVADFYQYACGGWMVNHPLEAEYSRFGSFDELGLRNLEQVNGLIKEIAGAEQTKGSVEQKIGDLYNMVMDTTRRDSLGVMPAYKNIGPLQEITSKEDLLRYLAHSLECSMWAMYVEADAMNSTMNILNECQAGFALGEKEYYFDQDEHTTMIRDEYKKHIAKMFELFGYLDGDLAADVILRMETRLAGAALNNVELRDPVANYNKMSIAELQQMVPQIDWRTYLDLSGLHTDSINVGQVEHLKEAGKMWADESLEDLKTFFIWQIIDGSAGYLSQDVYMENFHFYGQILSGTPEPKPLWKRATGMVNGTLGEAVGQMYVKKYFPEENKARMLALVKNLQKSLGERIQALDWMSDTTKAKAQEKLDAFTIKIGYPDKWRDYTALDIDPSLSLYENVLRASRFEQDYSISYLDKPVDKAKWYMTPQTVNAYYNPSSNEICFPAAILQYPFFDMSADDAFNYGAIGVVIGHEMTHGFDDQGCQFDKDGNLNNWWTAEDKAAFDARTKVMEEYFNAIEVAPGIHANGAFTLGENIADHGGLQISYQAFSQLLASGQAQLSKDESVYTPEQRFFLSYANVWAGNIRDEEVLRRTKSDPHSLGRWRVNGALPHIGAWYDAWGVTPDSPMFVPEEKRVHIW